MTANLLEYDLEGLAAFCEKLGEKRFRATQLFRWIHQRGARDFDRGVLQAVRTVHGVGVDAVGEVGADRARRCILRIGGAHQVAVLQHRALAFERLDHHRARDHELDERAEERALTVNGVETFGFLLRQVLHLRSDDLQAGLLEAGIDLADDVLSDGVGLDDGQGALQRHGISPGRRAAEPAWFAPEDNRKTRVRTRV